MRGFVGVDAGVLDKRMQMLARRLKLAASGNRLHGSAAIQTRVDVPGTRNLEARKTLDRAQCADEFFGYLSRSFAQLASELKCYRQSILAEFDLRRLLDDEVLGFDLI
jgi:hypothetical protein